MTKDTISKVWLWIEYDRALIPMFYSVYETRDDAIEVHGEPDFYSKLMELEVNHPSVTLGVQSKV